MNQNDFSIGHWTGTAIGIIWIIWLLIWFVSAFTAKRNAKTAGGKYLAYRALIIVLVYFIVRNTGSADFPLLFHPIQNAVVQVIGVVFTALGCGLALWARYYLGRNWGMPMSEKQGAELVTTGPYKYICHPIYSGVMLALFGSSFVLGVIMAAVFLFTAAYFIYSSVVEDGIMLRLFPDTYPAYKARTKRLIPWVW